MTFPARLQVIKLQILSSVGYISLAGALVVAHLNPATGYELSLYTSTPAGFWLGISVAAVCALVVVFTSQRGWERFVGLLLGAMASMAVLTLPILRGYFFHGIHDALSHVGWARRLTEQTVSVFDLVYPGIHTFGAVLTTVAGVSIWRSMQFVPFIIAAIFFIFVPLTVREIAGGRVATAVGAFSAFLLVPIHPVANSMHPHPSSQAILFAPVVLFLLFRYLRSTGPDHRMGIFTAIGATLFLAIFAEILYHPQQALNVLVILILVSIVHFVGNIRGKFATRDETQ